MLNIWKSLLLVFAFVLLAGPTVAYGYLYRAPLTTVESDGNAYTMLAIQVASDNAWLAANGFMETDALDTRVQTLGGLNRAHMVSDDRILATVPDIPASSQTNLYFATGETDLTAMDVVVGDMGHFWVPDAVALEAGNNFEFEQSGYFGTAAFYGNKKLVYKQEAFVAHQTSAGNITAGILSAEDFGLTMTKDGAWRTLDVSDFIDPSGTGVILEVYSTDGLPYQCAFRETGSTDDRYWDATHIWAAVGLDATQSFDYRVEHANLNVYIRGYSVGGRGWTFLTDAVDVSLPGAAAWVDIDLSTEVPVGTEGVIIEVLESAGAGPPQVGLRMKGSADNRTSTISGFNHFWAIVGCDANRIIEGWAGLASADFYLVGYITDGATFYTDAVDISLAGVGAWTDVDISGAAPEGKFAIIENTTNNNLHDYGFRKNYVTGAADSLYQEMNSKHSWSFVELDYAQIVEAEISNLLFDSFLIGYITSGLRHADTVTYTYTCSVATALADSDTEVLIYATGGGTNLIGIQVGVAAPVTAALVGAVPDTDTPWEFMMGDLSPHLAYATYDAPIATELTRYEPNTIIIGTVLPDRTAPDQDAEIVWGENPAGITVTLGGMVSSGQPTVGETPDTPSRSLLPEVGVTDWYQEPAITGELLANPFRPFMTMVSDNTTLTEVQTWRWLGLAVVFLVTAAAIKAVPRHLVIASAAAGVATVIMVISSVWPAYALVLLILCIFGGWVSERAKTI